MLLLTESASVHVRTNVCPWTSRDKPRGGCGSGTSLVNWSTRSSWMGTASWSISGPATRTGAPVATAMASAYPMRTIICRGSAVPVAVNLIRAAACAAGCPRRGPVVSAGSSSSMSTPVTVTPAARSRPAVIASAVSGKA